MPPHEPPSTSEPTAGATTPSTGLRLMAGPGYVGEWRLFCDYTAATGQPALPTTVAALTGFLTSLPVRPATTARRVRAIASAHRHAGYLLARPDHGPAAREAAGSRPTPEQMIAACPSRGWPTGLHGRRDAFLVSLVDVLGYAPHEARQLRPTDIILADRTTDHSLLRVRNRPVPAGADPRTCVTCACVRWLNILGTLDGLGRGSARMHLTAAEQPTRASAHGHTPDTPMRWLHAAVLLPGLDRHGWLDDYRPITTRTVRARLAQAAERTYTVARLAPDAPTATPDHTSSATSPRPPTVTQDLDEVLTVLDSVADDADALNARIQALLDDHT